MNRRAWQYTLELKDEWKALEEVIGDNDGVIKGSEALSKAFKAFIDKLKTLTDKLPPDERPFYEDEIENFYKGLYDYTVTNDTFDIEEANYRLGSFYDYCDAERIWVNR